jgi:hypothetical protein
MFTRAGIALQKGQCGEEMIAAIEKSGATPDHFHQAICERPNGKGTGDCL